MLSYKSKVLIRQGNGYNTRKKSTEDANELENSVKGKKDERKQTEHIKENKAAYESKRKSSKTGSGILINYHNGREL